MQKKLRYLSVGIIIAIVGIIYFQLDWSLQTYFMQENRNKEFVYTSLRLAVDDFQEDNKRQLGRELMDQFAPLVDCLRINYRHDSLDIYLENKYVPKLPDRIYGRISEPIHKITTYLPTVSVPKGKEVFLSDYVIDSGLARLQKLTNALQIEFLREVDSIYLYQDKMKLDSLFKEKLKNSPAANWMEKVNWEWVFDAKSNPDLQTMISERWYPYRASGLQGYNNRQKYVRILFNDTFRPTIEQLKFSFLSPFILILLMIFCFTALLRILKQQKQQAERKEQYINNRTHEFKTPLATISAATEGMQQFNVLEKPEKTQLYLQTIAQEAKRLEDLVGKILQINLLDKKGVDLHLEEVQVVSLIDDLIAAEKIRHPEGLDIQFTYQEPVPLVHADRTHLQNVLSNLIDNALKYTGNKPSVQIHLAQATSFLHIAVRDRGIGMDPSQLKKIFDPYYRIPTGNRHDVKGYGLGLHYVKAIVEMHGGRVEVQSKKGKGSEFSVYLLLIQ